MVPPPTAEHRRDLVLHPEERAAHVRADALVELVGVDVGERRRHRAVGGVVERRVEAAEARRARQATSAADESTSPTSVTAATAWPPARVDLVDDVGQRVGVTGAEHDGVAGGGERSSGLGADAATGAGDERDTVDLRSSDLS